MRSLFLRGHTRNLMVPGHAHPPLSGNFTSSSPFPGCTANLTMSMLEYSDLTREDLREMWRYTTSVFSTSELLPKDLPNGKLV